MAELNIGATTTSTKVSDYSISPKSPDSSQQQKETYWYNSNFTKYFGIYKSVAKIKNTLNTYATWCLGAGYITKSDIDRTILENITGWGEDTFNSIIWNMLVTKKVNGDAYAEIVLDDETGMLINLKPLNPEYVRHVVNAKGRIIAYDFLQPNTREATHRFKPSEILHFVNDRVTDEIHGVSVIEAIRWNIEATEEAKRIYRQKHKNGAIIGIVEVDTDDATKITNLKPEIKQGLEDGTFLMVPKGVLEVKPWDVKLDTEGTLAWLRYLDDDFYTSVGVPRVIMGGTNDSTEAAAKVGSVMFDPIYIREIQELQADIWNQLNIRVEWNKQNSMMDNVQSDQSKNQSQTGFQPNDMMAGVGK